MIYKLFQPPITCIGFGDFEGKCTNKALAVSGIWCERCEELRRAELTRRLEELSARFVQEKQSCPETS